MSVFLASCKDKRWASKHTCLRGRGGWSGGRGVVVVEEDVTAQRGASGSAAWLDSLQPNSEVILKGQGVMQRKPVHTYFLWVFRTHLQTKRLIGVRNRHVRVVKNLSAARARCRFSSKCADNGASLLKGIQRLFQRGGGNPQRLPVERREDKSVQ